MIGIMDNLTELEGFEPQIRARSNTWPLPRPDLDLDIKQEKCDPSELGEGLENNRTLPHIGIKEESPEKYHEERHYPFSQLNYQVPRNIFTGSKWNIEDGYPGIDIKRDKIDAKVYCDLSEGRNIFEPKCEKMDHNLHVKRARTDEDDTLEEGVGPQRKDGWNKRRCERGISVGGSVLESSLLGSSLTAPSGAKKSTSRRNAWGNLSYADLITQAIGSVPEKRLTLSQIYEWMVQNVPYFKDKGDSNSSAGWKNSIRHNLSLHSRFMRVQNEGTGKSSWWMIDPDAKPGKSSRRRATSMETSKFEKRRGRVRKKVEALRNGSGTAEATPSPSSSVSEGLDLFPDSPFYSTAGFQLSPDFRPRASSNASSCGRLSPIPNSENEWSGPASYSSGGFVSELAGNLADSMKLQPEPFLPGGYSTYQSFESYQPEAIAPYGAPQCLVHRLQGCNCNLSQCAPENMSPAGLSPSYPQSEPSPDPMGGAQPGFNPQSVPPRHRSTPSTMMGQLMGALNHTTVLDDLNLNIETMHGGFDCNVDEVIKHELSMDGSLDFNFSHSQTSSQGVGDNSQSASSYSTVSVTGPSWVH